MDKKRLLNIITLVISLILILTGYLVSNRLWSAWDMVSENSVSALFLFVAILNIIVLVVNIKILFSKKESRKIFDILSLIFSVLLVAYSSLMYLVLEAFKNFNSIG